MLKAQAVGLRTTSDKHLEASAVVIRDASGLPIVLVVEVSPNLQHVFSWAISETEFRDALKRYGIEFDADVDKLEL